MPSRFSDDQVVYRARVGASRLSEYDTDAFIEALSRSPQKCRYRQCGAVALCWPRKTNTPTPVIRLRGL